MEHTDNGITYKFDLTKNMFARGNIQEKIRMSAIKHPMKVFADLFSGIGYFTLQILKSNPGIEKAYLFEWNPDAVDYLKRNLNLNFKKKNPDLLERLKILPGDNRETSITCPPNSTDRINMGLIPCSCGSFQAAAHLSRLPCLIHVHHNIDLTGGNSEKNNLFDKNCCVTGRNFAQEIGNKLATLKNCDYEIVHIQKVKSYGPNVDHIVVDVLLK